MLNLLAWGWINLLELPEWILIERSISELGVDPRELTQDSNQKIYRKCMLCSNEYTCIFKNIFKSTSRCSGCFNHNTDDIKTKKCNACNIIKSIDEFGKRKSRGERGRRNFCKKCQTQKRKETRIKQFANDKEAERKYKENKKIISRQIMQIPENKEKNKLKQREIKEKFKNYINEYLQNHSCVDCGENDLEILTFDHIKELGEKQFNIGNLNGSPSHYAKFDEEVLKCEVRCVNCHYAIERIRDKGRLYCFINSLEYVSKPFKKRAKLKDNPTKQDIWHFEKAEEQSAKRHIFKNEYYKIHLPLFVEILKQGCMDCKKYFPLSMQFDHLPQFEKKNIISTLFFCQQKTWAEVLEEIAKCELVCGNCHRKRTNKRLRENWNV